MDENTIMEILTNEKHTLFGFFFEQFCKEQILDHEMHEVITVWSVFNNAISETLNELCSKNNLLWFVHSMKDYNLHIVICERVRA